MPGPSETHSAAFRLAWRLDSLRWATVFWCANHPAVVVLGVAAAVAVSLPGIFVAMCSAWLLTATGVALGLCYRNAAALRFSLKQIRDDSSIGVYVWRDYFPEGLPAQVWTGGIEPYFIIVCAPKYGNWDAIQMAR
jgi:hypothetical protein